MWARVSTYQFPPTDVEKTVDQFNEALDTFLGQPGLKRAEVFVNRRSGAGITITIWESEDAMKASEDDADRLRRHVTLELVGWIESVKEYELVRSEPSV